ncbi:isoaspartyl peptidase/L-asparaginase isoform X2 [Eurytemora carolleeae]|uniref:isoaspartyl peptidase/L-asparaginase isoform X1 n=1 Tax=Eurytemora carolleeae TaxID=1294199 RepID=UPI000C769A80|nr:isoaspartyl peptidase/L-asparaginase isoform X1 [Eurytemora carolleeae]XP_023344407.1 isoaspartyl peptidase/L-asparaginase isoform X2 [Eurytemora carolleeae]|eukprot:XP_023344406.1 isoaspartyl peptidase/L-asparaginase-like isoform X1 [Eurytemora affinis]
MKMCSAFVLLCFSLQYLKVSGGFDIKGNIDVAPVVLVHGGAGSIPPEYEEEKINGMKNAVREGWNMLQSSDNALNAAISAVKIMEDDPAFNAGRGSKLTILGQVEMDAAVMDGKQMEAGGVACLKGIKHPIEAARSVMENSSHVLLVGEGAGKFAIKNGGEEVGDDWLITDRSRQLLDEYLRNHNISHIDSEMIWTFEHLGHQFGHGTVGAVVVDTHGNLAAATSTGGITGKIPGRVGDSPSVGHGVFADNLSAAISCTGSGETFMKAGVARRIASKIEMGLSPKDAAEEALEYMKVRVGGSGGVIVLDPTGNIGIHWNSKQMAWAYAKDGKLHYGINVGEDFIEDL